MGTVDVSFGVPRIKDLNKKIQQTTLLEILGFAT
jgi:hypothetical protein